ncbi:hypothetical protein D3C78_1651140 [compost metagenome]
MATLAIVLKTTKKLANGEYAVSLRITHERIRKYININNLTIDGALNFRCTIEHWREALPEDNAWNKMFHA